MVNASAAEANTAATAQFLMVVLNTARSALNSATDEIERLSREL